MEPIGLLPAKQFVAKLNLAKTTQQTGGFSFWGKNDTLILVFLDVKINIHAKLWQ